MSASVLWANRRAKILIEVAWIRKVKQLVESSLTLQEKVMDSAGISAICVIIFCRFDGSGGI